MMEWTSLLVNLQKTRTDWREKLSLIPPGMKLVLADDDSQAISALKKGEGLCLIILSDHYSWAVEKVLKAYQNQIGCFPDFQAIICDQPDPYYMAHLFEFGIDQFIATDNWPQQALAFIKQCADKFTDSETSHNQLFSLQQASKLGQKETISRLVAELNSQSSYDALVAFACARAQEASGQYQQAMQNFKTAHHLNRLFLPAAEGLGENLLLNGKVDEAITILEELEGKNPHCQDRKLMLANAYSDKGEQEKASKLLQAAQALNPKSEKLAEAQAYFFLSFHKLQEAMQLLDQLQEVGPHLASKLNEMGVKMSQAGKGQHALVLYQKAHKIVRQELKYKVSLNAALACHRIKQYDKALKYLERCEKEYGKSFPKLEKIAATIKASMGQST